MALVCELSACEVVEERKEACATVGRVGEDSALIVGECHSSAAAFRKFFLLAALDTGFGGGSVRMKKLRESGELTRVDRS